jgi:hypothetical protein
LCTLIPSLTIEEEEEAFEEERLDFKTSCQNGKERG